MRWFGFLAWVKNSFEGDDGKSSFKRLIPFTLTMLVVYMVVFDKIPKEDRYITSIALLVTSALYVGIVTIAQLYNFYLTFKGGKPNNQAFEDQIKDGDKVTIKKDE